MARRQNTHPSLVAFLQPPDLDFELHGAANLLDLPGLHGMIRQAATEAVTREAVWPNKVTTGKTTFGDLILVRYCTIGAGRCGW